MNGKALLPIGLLKVFLQQEASRAKIETFTCKNERRIVVSDLEAESEVPVAVCTPFQQCIFTADDGFLMQFNNVLKCYLKQQLYANLLGRKMLLIMWIVLSKCTDEPDSFTPFYLKICLLFSGFHLDCLQYL